MAGSIGVGIESWQMLTSRGVRLWSTPASTLDKDSEKLVAGNQPEYPTQDMSATSRYGLLYGHKAVGSGVLECFEGRSVEQGS